MCKIIISLAALFLFSFDGVARSPILSVHGSNLTMATGGRSKRLKLQHNVLEYAVNCKGSKAILWGFPNNLRLGDEPSGGMTLIDLRRGRIVKYITSSKTPFFLRFLRDGKLVYVSAMHPFLINIESGRVIYTESTEEAFEFESC